MEKKISLVLLRKAVYPKLKGKPSLLIVNNEDEFDRECKELKQVYAIVVMNGKPKKVDEIPKAIQPLIKEFEELFQKSYL